MLQQGIKKFELLRIFGASEKSIPCKRLRAADKSQGACEKNKEKVEANCTGFSAEFFGSQSLEMFCFVWKTKIKILTTSYGSLTRIH